MNKDLSAGFDRAAARYDLMVALNPGYHEHLTSAATALVERVGAGAEICDLGCGSGASTRALLRAGAGSVLGIDASPGMLARARRQDWPAGVRFTTGRAEHLDRLLDEQDAQPDGVYACYLFRNLAPDDRDRVLRTVHDRLPPGGWLVVQDYSVQEPWPRRVWSLVCWVVVIPLARLLLGDTSLYRYLWRSGFEFDPPAVFCDRLAAAGFTDIAHRTAGGWQRGILHTFVARRAQDSHARRAQDSHARKPL
ncbi:methyltransferase domain-containing protein [Enemella evansiae]|uniref:methyltransferase domain-containing protein n=1 Tax=Enemella evansiae TaxID=2016499 RepID=UPI001E48BB8E|nr:methyltransferase domain-containing protein [Enemella evansiae]